MVNRTRIEDGIEAATSEYFDALRAVNFITQQNFSSAIDPKEERNYNLDEMIEHTKVITSERGLVNKFLV